MFLISLFAGVLAALTFAGSAQAAAYTIASDGTGCAAIGTWDAGTHTCTVNQDLTVLTGIGIKMTGSSLTLDGAGHTMTGGSAAGNYAINNDDVASPAQTGLTVRNFNIVNFDTGIRIYNGDSSSIYSNRISGCNFGIFLTQAADNNVAWFNTIENSAVEGVHIYSSNSNILLENNFISNAAQANVGGTSSGNNFSFFGVGNYWNDYDSPAEGCMNTTAFDLHCDGAYNPPGGAPAGVNDPGPWVLMNAWTRSDWTWYDNVGGDNWVLLANRIGGSGNLVYDLMVNRSPWTLTSMPGYGPGCVPPGSAIYNKYSGMMDGPVSAMVRAGGADPVASQRILWPKGGNSLEEIPGVWSYQLDSRVYWPWYDMASPGYKDWILISNPNDYLIHYSVSIAGVTRVADGTIPAGGRAIPTFPGIMGGPVEVNAWDDSLNKVNIMASQRVLSNSDTSFNEVPGVAQSSLGSDYVWTWYDMTGGARDWIMIANPATQPDGSPSTGLWYTVYIAGVEVARNELPLGLGQNQTLTFPGTMNGPVEVKTYSDYVRATPARSICSQRAVWGPSFEEVMGENRALTLHSYNWTWYDMYSSGARNWVLAANPLTNADGSANVNPITVTVRFTDKLTGAPQEVSNDLAPGERWTPVFPDMMGGPVQVSAVLSSDHVTGADVIASQRVLWNGYFNEVWGQ
ncbi:MAG: NosD domain-containing protein [Thermoleophilia bacterium]